MSCKWRPRRARWNGVRCWLTAARTAWGTDGRLLAVSALLIRFQPIHPVLDDWWNVSETQRPVLSLSFHSVDVNIYRPLCEPPRTVSRLCVCVCVCVTCVFLCLFVFASVRTVTFQTKSKQKSRHREEFSLLTELAHALVQLDVSDLLFFFIILVHTYIVFQKEFVTRFTESYSSIRSMPKTIW